MPWLKKIQEWLNGDTPASQRKSQKGRQALRCCRVESMEPRCMLSADPIFLGAVYIEQDLGSDDHGDTFEISFTGGAADTELTRLVINTDQIEFGNTPGFGLGDAFFDTAPGGLGTDASRPFEVVSLTTADPTATVTATVVDGGQELVLEFTNFKAGDKLIFSIDVDEVLEFDPNETDLAVINDGFDPITSGREFRNSQLSAEFIAPHYYDSSGYTLFVNEYDPLLVGTNLDLSPDNVDGKRDRTAGGVLNTTQEPLPISISGTVFEENNLDLVQDADEPGIANVELALWVKENGTFVFTGHTTTTDSNGDYSFGTDLGLPPSVYQVREAQPDGYLSVGAIPGTVAGVDIGQIVVGNPDILTEVDIPLGGTHAIDYDFSEYRPGEIHGNVHLTLNDDDCFDETVVHPPLEGVKIELFDKDGILLETTYTDADGNYSFTNLLPGTYTVVETTPAHLIDSGERAGKVNGVTNGAVVGNDTIGGIVLQVGRDRRRLRFLRTAARRKSRATSTTTRTTTAISKIPKMASPV